MTTTTPFRLHGATQDRKRLGRAVGLCFGLATLMDSSVRGARDGTLGRSSRRSVSTGSGVQWSRNLISVSPAFFDLLRSRHLGGILDSEQFKQEAEKIEQSLSAFESRRAQCSDSFMNGDFTQWDLYLASSSEYAMRLIDGFISMLESRNLVCVAQLLRAQVGSLPADIRIIRRRRPG